MRSTRRRFVQSLIGAAAGLRTRQAAAEPLALAPVGAGAYAHFGQIALTTPANAGDIANIGVVVGSESVAVIDTGGSMKIGRALRAAVRALTDKPVRYVINTHEHPDHIFGNAAFADEAVFVGHHALPAELARRGEYYLRSYRDALGADAIAEVRIIPPTLLVESATTLDLGARRLRLTAWSPPAHTACDLTVLDEASGILFSGDLVFLEHVPVVDASVTGWLAVLPRLARLPAQEVVPGHGRRASPWPAALDDERRYLETLAADARSAIKSGTPLAAAVRQIAQSERDRWQLFDDYNRRNATVAFSELEWE